LQNQEFKLKDIEKIINAMNPKKLIDIDNLEEALLLLGKMAGIKLNFNLGVNPNTGLLYRL
jgi:hypothetical protein